MKKHWKLITFTVIASFGAMALADPGEVSAKEPAPSITVTVDGTDYPLCAEEDCSDVPGQRGVWINNEGVAYLELGEHTTLRIER